MDSLEIALEPLEKNREGALKVRKAPRWRAACAGTTMVLWLACLPLILGTASSTLAAVLTAAGVLLALALVVWYLMANRVSGLHSGGLQQIAISSETRYCYRLLESRLERTGDGSRRSWPAAHYVGHQSGHGYALLIFRSAVCYLPFRGAPRQDILNFVDAVERWAASHR